MQLVGSISRAAKGSITDSARKLFLFLLFTKCYTFNKGVFDDHFDEVLSPGVGGLGGERQLIGPLTARLTEVTS